MSRKSNPVLAIASVEVGVDFCSISDDFVSAVFASVQLIAAVFVLSNESPTMSSIDAGRLEILVNGLRVGGAGGGPVFLVIPAAGTPPVCDDELNGGCSLPPNCWSVGLPP